MTILLITFLYWREESGTAKSDQVCCQYFLITKWNLNLRKQFNSVLSEKIVDKFSLCCELYKFTEVTSNEYSIVRHAGWSKCSVKFLKAKESSCCMPKCYVEEDFTRRGLIKMEKVEQYRERGKRQTGNGESLKSGIFKMVM